MLEVQDLAICAGKFRLIENTIGVFPPERDSKRLPDGFPAFLGT